jgi:hypothetical protein
MLLFLLCFVLRRHVGIPPYYNFHK